MSEEASNVVCVDVRSCARCQGDHDKLTFKELTYYVFTDGSFGDEDVLFTHWALCPDNGEPIMMSIETD